MPTTLKRIEYSAFAKCKNLKRVQLPRGLKYIGKACFYGSGLEEIKFPSSVRVVGIWAFKNCEQLRYVGLNKGLKVFGETWDDGENKFDDGVFYESGIESIKIPPTLEEIRTATFHSCKNLKTVELPRGLKKIGVDAFYDSGLESIVLPSSVKIVSAFAFAYCKKLRNIELNKGLEVLGAKGIFYKEPCRGNVFQKV